ncbi:MAG TPA: T9SS type A sorting domain-containing protein [Bacteroidetes bacterium]|nr:T9SS type A sorting domain-containing protein [Bacteroidota bacterium]
MKKFYLPFFLLAMVFLFAKATTNAQVTCDAPNVIVDDNMDEYEAGALGPQADHWSTWDGMEGGDEDGIVSPEFTYDDSPFSLKIQGGAASGGPQDVLLLLGDKTSGVYVLQWKMYVIETLGGYYNIQHIEGSPGGEYAFEANFDADGTMRLNAGTADVRSVSYPHNTWFNVRHLIDLDNDIIYLWVANKFVYSWPFSYQAGELTGTKQIGAVDFFPRSDNDWFYIDNVYFAEGPAAEAGKYCHMSPTVIEPGTYTVGTLDCFGAGFTVRDNGKGSAGAWYSYTPDEDGLIAVSACGSGQDSRVWVFSGGCENLNIEAVNDDLCAIDVPGEKEWASYVEALVTGGETYLILWDNIWDVGNFDFTLDFTTDPPADGDFCQTAIAVTPGTYTIDQINGHGNVSGPIIDHTGASTTNYAQSEWYSFTPDMNGKMTVSSCGMTTEDTRLWIYTGECGIENVNLVANDDDGCDVQSLVSELDVSAGTTYYIEWDSETLDAPGFDWELSFDPEVAVTEKEFLSAFSIRPNPASSDVYVKYSFSEMTDLDIRLFNSLGQMVSAKSLGEVLSGSERLELAGLSSGVYFVMMTDGVNTAAQRLVVE